MNKLQCLRHVVANLSAKRLPSKDVSTGDLDDLNFYKCRMVATGEIIGIEASGGEAFERLVELCFSNSPLYQRGTTVKEVSDQIFPYIIENYLQPQNDSISDRDVALLDEAIDRWFTAKAQTQTMFVPCAITGFPGPRFVTGPVSFQHASTFRPGDKVDPESLAKLLELMGEKGATWIATIEVSDCQPNRAWELGELAVDLALAGLQLFLPEADRMSRMNARTIPQFQLRISDRGATWSNHAPGLALVSGALEQHLDRGERLLESVGNRIRNFVDPSCTLRRLNSAWADAAYWFHEGLAEPLDSIAVPKLETAVEVLMRSENSKGSQSRLIKAIEVFYGLSEGDPLNPYSQTSIGQLAKSLVADRSRILHGTTSTLGGTFLSSRDSLTGLVRGLLSQYSIALDTYSTTLLPSDDVKVFLEWVDTQRSAKGE